MFALVATVLIAKRTAGLVLRSQEWRDALRKGEGSTMARLGQLLDSVVPGDRERA
jgi:hypothetical protein